MTVLVLPVWFASLLGCVAWVVWHGVTGGLL